MAGLVTKQCYHLAHYCDIPDPESAKREYQSSAANIDVIPRTVSWLYGRIKEHRSRTGARFLVRVSYLDIRGSREESKPPGTYSSDWWQWVMLSPSSSLALTLAMSRQFCVSAVNRWCIAGLTCHAMCIDHVSPSAAHYSGLFTLSSWHHLSTEWGSGNQNIDCGQN